MRTNSRITARPAGNIDKSIDKKTIDSFATLLNDWPKIARQEVTGCPLAYIFIRSSGPSPVSPSPRAI